ncbi:MAG TPA: hypothetical protein VNW06_02200 [Cytophagaceae bacterium]|nr:hypothetical protein [Cytophagaceae bacterium]
MKQDTSNIDEINIYFTTSGNWTEIKKLNEKRTRKSMRDNFKRARIFSLLE